MTEVKNKEWQNWVGPNAWDYIPKEERTCVTFAFPVMNPFPPHEWMVFKPFTTDYMIVPYDEYMEHVERIKRSVWSRYK